MPRPKLASLATILILGCASFAAADAAAQSQAAKPGPSQDQMCRPAAMWVWSQQPSPKPVRSVKPLSEKQRALLRPMNRDDVRQLVAALTPVVGKSGERSIERSIKRSRLTLERIEVLAEDSMAVLARVHLRETLDLMKGLPNPDLGGIAMGNELLKSFDWCGRARYAQFGGDPEFDRVRTLVLDHRMQLEPLITGSMMAQGAPGSGRPR